MKKMFYTFMCIFIIIIASYASVNAQDISEIRLKINNPNMLIDNVEKEIDPGRNTCPVVVGNTTLIPIRSLIENLGGAVTWNGDKKKVTIELKQNKIELWVNEKNAVVNDTIKTLETTPKIIKSRVMIPIRFVSENLGYLVSWGNDAKIVISLKNKLDYTVQNGDTLYDLSNKYSTTINNIKKYNNLSSDFLYIGQKLIIPTNTIKNTLLIDNIFGISKNDQAVLVVSNSPSSNTAKLNAYERVGAKWVLKHSDINANIGKYGFSLNSMEGDFKSPAGIFSIGFMFGTAPNPGVKVEYRRTDGNQYWVDDPYSSLYNTWQTGPANGRWYSAEDLYIPAYKYAAVINYNTKEIIPKKGSAMFLHISNNNYTAGCTAISEANLLKILRWLDPNKNPVIIQGTEFQINSF